jgi:TIR domain
MRRRWTKFRHHDILMRKSPQVFISYASRNRTEAIKLHQKFLASQFTPWMDKLNLSPGQEWRPAIRIALRKSDFVVVLLSSATLPPRGFFKYEIDEAISLFEEKPQRKKFIIPVRLDECDVPTKLSEFQWVDIYKRSGWSALVRSLRDENGERASNHKQSRVRPKIVSISEPPESLTSRPFVFSKPRWLTKWQQKRLSEIAKAAFVLLLFEQTEKGCWGKSYLLGKRNLPEALGAITGTPFALIAISSYAHRGKSEKGIFSRTELLVHRSNNFAVLRTMAELLWHDGRVLKHWDRGYVEESLDFEGPRHEAGACLIRMLYDKPEDRDFKTITRLCECLSKPTAYDLAVVARSLQQVRYIDGVPAHLDQRVRRREEFIFNELRRKVNHGVHGNIATKGTMRHESINQWSTAWYLLPMLKLESIAPKVRVELAARIQQFFLARASAAISESSLLPSNMSNSVRDKGVSSFGTGIGLVAFRILECRAQGERAQLICSSQMVDRIIGSAADVIEGPMLNPKPDIPEGYLGWGAICLGAASVGIHIGHNECAAAIALTKELSNRRTNCSEKSFKVAYRRAIRRTRLIAPDLVEHVATAAAKLALLYEPVKRAVAQRDGVTKLLESPGD